MFSRDDQLFHLLDAGINAGQHEGGPDDGSLELTDPSRSSGFETRTSIQLTDHLSFDGGITKVFSAFFRDSGPRVYLDSAPSFTTNAALTLARWRGWTGSLRMRAVNHYRLDGVDPSIRAAGHTVFDMAWSRCISHKLDLNFAMDNLFDRDYWEVQNFFESRLPGQSLCRGSTARPATDAPSRWE